jgi:leader peptidase (prepilin peptidase)/N-methyltransferase
MVLLTVMIIAVLIVFGLCLGSFVNALVWRLHEQTSSKKKRTDKKLSIANGRSMCPHCHHELAAKDLVPLLSWLSLGGKCRYCRKSVSWQYPVVEIATAVLFVLSYILWPGDEAPFSVLQTSANFIVWLVILTGFMALIIYDLKWMLLPNRIVMPLMVLAGALALMNIALDGTDALLNTIYGVLIAGGLFYMLFQISGGKWIGGGDVKLGALIGLVLADPFLAFLMLLTASSLGTIAVLPALIMKRIKTTSRIPFGPFLIISTILVKLFGASLIGWYKRSLGLET